MESSRQPNREGRKSTVYSDRPNDLQYHSSRPTGPQQQIYWPTAVDLLAHSSIPTGPQTPQTPRGSKYSSSRCLEVLPGAWASSYALSHGPRKLLRQSLVRFPPVRPKQSTRNERATVSLCSIRKSKDGLVITLFSQTILTFPDILVPGIISHERRNK